MQNIFLSNFLNDDYLSRVSNELSKSSNIFVGGFFKKNSIYNAKINYFNYSNFSNRSLFDKLKINYSNKLNFSDIDFLEKNFYLYAQCCDRTFIKKISVRSHKKFYIDICTYLISVFIEKKISKIVLSDTPHLPVEIILYIIAKLLRLKIIILRHTKFKNKIVISEDIEFNKRKILKIKNNIDAILAKKLFDEIFSKEDLYEIRSKQINSTKILLGKNLFRSLKSKIFFLLNFRSIIKKYDNETYFDLKWYETIFYLIKRERQRIALINWQNNNCINLNLKDKYIYFALHFQPERTTDPEAGFLTNQLYALQFLSDNIPDDWYIYVKEHPRQLNDNKPDIRKLHFRDIKDYEDIKNIKKIKFIHFSVDDEELLKNCLVSCSLQGSTLWKGMIYGKPGISFNETWHSLCRSSPIANLDSFKKQLISLSSKDSKEVKNDLYEFCKDFTMFFLHALNMGNFSKDYLEDKTLIYNLSNFIKD